MRRVSESESKARRAVQQATVAAPLPCEGTPRERVFAVSQGEYEQRCVAAIFITRAKAEAWALAHGFDNDDIEEYPLDRGRYEPAASLPPVPQRGAPRQQEQDEG